MPEPIVISSLQNPAVRNVVKLRDNRHRQRERLVVVDGIPEIRRAISAGLRLTSLFVAVDAKPDANTLANACPNVTCRVTDAVLHKMAFGQHHRDAVAVFEEPGRNIAALKLGPMPLVVVLDEIEKPGNVGAVFRSADAIGADAVVLCEGACDLFNPSVIRSSLGTVFAVPAVQSSRTQTLAWLAEHQFTIVTARVDAKATFWEIDYRQPIAIVIGSESQGLGEQWKRGDSAVDRCLDVRIPMQGSADSLNASVSAALLLFEAKRQRQLG